MIIMKLATVWKPSFSSTLKFNTFQSAGTYNVSISFMDFDDKNAIFFLTAEKKLIHMTTIDPTHC